MVIEQDNCIVDSCANSQIILLNPVICNPLIPAGGCSTTAYCGYILKKPPYVDFFLDFSEVHAKINTNMVDVGEEPLPGEK